MTPNSTAVSAIANALDAAIRPLNILDHPLYQLWNHGELPREVISLYARQYHHHVDAFPRYISAIHSNCADTAARQMLLEHLIEEESETATKSSHPNLWRQFATGLGDSLEAVEAERPLANTSALVQLFFDKCRQSYAAGLGILYAYESQVPEVADFKIKALQNFYNVQDARTLSFFEVHREADVHHRHEIASLIAALSPAEQAEAEAAAVEGARALWQFLDGVAEAANLDLANMDMNCAVMQ
jgi:pyrroloquinoline-quinone synthase